MALARLMLSAWFALVVAIVTPLSATADSFDFDGGPAWHIALGLGPANFPVRVGGDDTRFLQQMHAAGLQESFWGMALNASTDVLVVDFLAVGVELSYQLNRGETAIEAAGNIRQDIAVTPLESFGFHRLVGLAYLQPTVRVDRFRTANIEVALQLALGGGGVFWTWRGETERGSALVLRPGLLVDWYGEHFSFGLRIAMPFTWIEDLGPNELSHSPTTCAEFTLRLGARF